MADKIEPALTPEEWAKYRHFASEVWEDPAISHIGIAAVILDHSQPFRFTHEDVRMLFVLADRLSLYATSVTDPVEDPPPLRDLAGRIAALLPPKEVLRG